MSLLHQRTAKASSGGAASGMEGTAHPQAVKLLLVGDSGTGKSSLLLRFTEDKFLGEDIHMATIGVDFKVKFLDLADLGIHRLKLTIWDTAGQERFRTLTSSYFRGAHGVVLVYDVNDRDTFRSISDIWLPELERSSTSQSKNYAPVLMLVGNKVDKSEQQVTTAEGQRLAKDLRCLFMECSAKTRVGVRAAFEELVRKVIDSPHVWAETSSSVFSAYGDTSASNQCAC